MAFYLAHPADTGVMQAVSPAVKERGLSLLRAKPCEVQVSVIPVSIQPGYACYLRNIPAYMEAASSGVTTLISNRGYPVTEVPFVLPWQLPSLIYDFPKTPTDTKMDELRTHSTVIKGRGKSTTFVMTEPTLEKIRALVNADNPCQKTAHVIGTVNLDAMKVVFVLNRILSMFLLTHTYPAFRHATDLNPTDKVSVSTRVKRRKTGTTSFVACVTRVQENLEEPKTTEGDESEDTATTTERDIRLTYAKPVKVSQECWGPVHTIPNASGLYVPFVKELAVGDTITLPSLVSTTFIRCLATNTMGMFQKADELRSAWGLIANTSLGHEVTHLAKCIDIALQAQAVVYPVYAGTIYEGSVISGAGYSISVKNVVYDPVSYEELQKVVSDASAHSRSIRDIVAVVGPQVEACKSMRELSALLLESPIDELTKNTVIEAACSLSYPNKYWSTSIPHIRRAMELISKPTTAITTDVPLHPKFLFSTDRVERVLSAFGHQAPTFMIPNGQKLSLASADPPRNFHVRTIATNAAVLDMKYVLENGYVTNNMNNLSSKHKDTPLKGPDKTEIWMMLKMAHTTATGQDDDERKPAPKVQIGRNADDDFW